MKGDTTLDRADSGAMALMNSSGPTRGQIKEMTERDALRHRVKSLASSVQVVAGDDPDNFRHKLYEATCDAMMSLWDEAVRQERDACGRLALEVYADVNRSDLERTGGMNVYSAIRSRD
jgi:hypothetical protein